MTKLLLTFSILLGIGLPAFGTTAYADVACQTTSDWIVFDEDNGYAQSNQFVSASFRKNNEGNVNWPDYPNKRDSVLLTASQPYTIVAVEWNVEGESKWNKYTGTLKSPMLVGSFHIDYPYPPYIEYRYLDSVRVKIESPDCLPQPEEDVQEPPASSAPSIQTPTTVDTGIQTPTEPQAAQPMTEEQRKALIESLLRQVIVLLQKIMELKSK